MPRGSWSEFLAEEQRMVDSLLTDLDTSLAAGKGAVDAIQPAVEAVDTMEVGNPMRTVMIGQLTQKIGQVLTLKSEEISKLSMAAAVVSKQENRDRLRAARNTLESIIDKFCDLNDRLRTEIGS